MVVGIGGSYNISTICFFYIYKLRAQQKKQQSMSGTLAHQFALIRNFSNSQESTLRLADKRKNEGRMISKLGRLEQKHQITPGPGTYDGIIRQKHTSDFRVVKDSDNNIKKEHQWILGDNRKPFEDKNLTGSSLGPGQYNQNNTIGNSQSHSNWCKGTRFDYTKQKEEKVGPGYYNLCESTHAGKLSGESAFKSRSPKSFLEQIIKQKTKSLIKMKSQQQPIDPQIQDLVKTEEKEIKKTNKMSPMFLSKSLRAKILNENSPENVGPGSYTFSLEANYSQYKPKGIISGIHYNLSPLKNHIQEEKTDFSPGPGTYNLRKDLQQSQKQSKSSKLGFITRQQRFKQEIKKLIPGPGQYMQKKYILVDQESIRLQNKGGSFFRKAQKGCDFGKGERSSLIKSSNVPFGQYNVRQFDMEYKMLKQKQHYQKLRLMEVDVPIFNSKLKK